MGKAVIEFAKFFKKSKPDFNIILGDRYEMFASAIASYQMNIPNVHIHGGDKSGGLDEYTRHAITKISNIHFTATKKSSQSSGKMNLFIKNQKKHTLPKLPIILHLQALPPHSLHRNRNQLRQIMLRVNRKRR